jgi:hypothetical protein
MTKAESALAKVQTLYVLQVHLWNVLDAKNLSPAQRQDARKQLKEFASLLRKADWQIMGGEDVFTALKQMEREVSQKLKSRGSISRKPSVRGRAMKKRR